MVLSALEHNSIGLAITTIGIIGLIINLKLFKKLKNEPNSLLLNMVICNAAMILLGYPFPIISSFSHKWAFNSMFCTYYGSIALVLGFNIMLSTLMLCLDMLFEKKFETYEANKSNVRSFMIAFMWISCTFFGLAPVFGWSRIGHELTDTSCTVDFVNADSSYFSYIITVFLFMMVIPSIIMLGSAFSETRVPRQNEALKFVENDKKILSLMLMFLPVWTPYAICYLWPLFYDINSLSISFNAWAPVFAKLSVIGPPLLFLAFKSDSKTTKSQ